MSKSLRITWIKAENVKGIRELELAPDGKITEISGRNGTGKSSVVRVIQNVLGGGESLAQLARLAPNEAGEWVPVPGAEPRIVALLGEPGKPHQYQIDKTASGVTVKERVGDTKGFKTIKKPQALLDSLSDGRAANPVPFIRAAELGREKELSNLILETLPLEHNEARLLEILGNKAHLVEGRSMLAKLHPIEEIGLTRSAIFTARTGINTKRDEKLATANDLKKSLPAYEDVDSARRRLELAEAEWVRLRDLMTTMKVEMSTLDAQRIDAAKKAFETSTATAVAAKAAAQKAAEEAYTAAIKAADQEYGMATRGAKQALTDAQLAAAREREAENAELLKLREAQDAAEIGRRHAVEAMKAISDNVAVSARADVAEEEAAVLDAQSRELTKIIYDLDDFARSLADQIPIPGLVIKPGKITLNGIPIHQQNTAELAKFAVRVSLLRTAGTPLPWVVVDGVEFLDDENRRALIAELQQVPDLQIFMARVDASAIEIKNDAGEVVGEVTL